MDQTQLFKQLDEAEARQLARWESWLSQAAKSIPWREYERLKKVGGTMILNQLPAPLNSNPGALAKQLSRHAADMLRAGQAHAQVLADDLHRRYRTRNMADEYPGFDWEYEDNPKVISEKAVKAMEARSIRLAGDVDGELLAGVKRIMVQFISGTSRPDSEAAVEQLLQSTRERASMITTTETTYSYNCGRLLGYKENRVDYVRFSAIMDARTSGLCRSRHGLVMRLDDSRVSANTPPLHPRCRSVLDPLYSSYQPEMLTDKSMDWSQAIPLPPGWTTAPTSTSAST